MDEATRALREEVKQLPAELRTLIPSFESIISLADESELRKGPLNGSMDGVLLCLVQISAYIGYVLRHVTTLRVTDRPSATVKASLKMRTSLQTRRF
jgi:hypothetical protein